MCCAIVELQLMHIRAQGIKISSAIDDALISKCTQCRLLYIEYQILFAIKGAFNMHALNVGYYTERINVAWI